MLRTPPILGGDGASGRGGLPGEVPTPGKTTLLTDLRINVIENTPGINPAKMPDRLHVQSVIDLFAKLRALDN
jgi:hypothetical protein